MQNFQQTYVQRIFGGRVLHPLEISDLPSGLRSIASAVARGEYTIALDWCDQLLSAFPAHDIEILNHAYMVYRTMPHTTHSRYDQYQHRHVEFAIEPHERVLDLGVSNIPFPLATHYATIRSLTALPTKGISSTPIDMLKGKPLYECDIEYLPFTDQFFDVVYCSHILHTVENPDRVCRELMRIAKRGYIETPTRAADILFSEGRDAGHRFAIESTPVEEDNYGLLCTEYASSEDSALGHDLLANMYTTPQSDRERALSALLLLRADRMNTMFCWQGEFSVEVRRVKSEVSVKEESSVQESAEILQKAQYPIASIVEQAENKSVQSTNTLLFVNTYYPAFLDAVYRRNPTLSEKSYAEQLSVLNDQSFGDSDFYSQGMIGAGLKAEDIIINAPQLQQAWCREYGVMQSDQWGTALQQIHMTKPTILYVQDMNATPREFLRSARSIVQCIVGQIATPIERDISWQEYDMVFTSFPHYADRLREKGLKVFFQPLAFDPRVLQKIPKVPYHQRKHEVSFVGGISSYHTDSLSLLEQLALQTPIAMFGYGAESLPLHSAIRTCHHGEAWGIDMFGIMAQSKITINRHSPIAEQYANNMRLFEATGCGALLITDFKENLADFFVLGKEIITYHSHEECVELVRYYHTHPDEAERIARAGQERSLRDHSYRLRMAKTAEIIRRHMRLQEDRRREQSPLDYARISYGHQAISAHEVQGNTALLSAWQDESIPVRQRQLVNSELADMYRGHPPKPFTVLCDLIREIVRPHMSFLDIGCAGGYYYEGLEYLLKTTLDYTGTDYSEPLIAMARSYYPHRQFAVADGAHLPYVSASFDLAMSSGVLLVVENPAEHIAEAARVSNRWVVLHRIPVCYGREIRYMKKFAYHVETFEQVLPMHLIEQWLRESKLHLVKTIVYEKSPETDTYWMSFLAEKMIEPV